MPITGAAPATREFFVPTTGYSKLDATARHIGWRVDDTGTSAMVEFYVPHDFSNIVEVGVIRIARATGTHRLNYVTSYGAVGEDGQTHSASLLDVDTAETLRWLYEQDVSALFGALSAGDVVGIEIYRDAINPAYDQILGVRFRYS